MLEEFPNAPDLFFIYRELMACPDLVREPGGWVYQGKFYPDYLTVGGASFGIMTKAGEWCKGVGIDVGAGLWPLPGAIPCDIGRGTGAGRDIHDIEAGSLDFLFSSHCLEHIGEWRDEIKSWVRKLKMNGVIFLYLPHPDCAIWRPGSPFVKDGHKWSPSPSVIKEAIENIGCEIVACDDGPDVMQSFYVCGQKTV
jgi:hypothetical protein